MIRNHLSIVATLTAVTISIQTVSFAFIVPLVTNPTTLSFLPSVSHGKVNQNVCNTGDSLPLYAIAISPTSKVMGEEKVSVQLPIKDIAPEDQWIVNLDYEAFGEEVTALGKELQSIGGTEDVKHLQKIMLWRDTCAAIGLLSIWMTPNPITIVALSTWTYASWTMIAHHTCHGGYNRHSNSNGINQYNSRGFALGSVMQRCRDWLDWMAPEAWNVEHNRLHHYRLNELSDPDLVQRNLGTVRDSSVPMIVKYAATAILFPIWKWFYYAPNTFKELQISKWKQEGKELPAEFDPKESVTVLSLVLPGSKFAALREVVKPAELLTQVLGPFLLSRFVLLSLPLLLVPQVGPTLWGNAMINILLAELLTNIHSYLTIVTNHAGEDLYTFGDAVKPRSPSFYVRQVVGSANYVTNNDDITDFCHGFLNYQIEHHVWPDLSMRQYQLGAPRLQAICHKYGVPYVIESVWTRLRKTVDIMVGKTSMRVFPTEYEPIRDKTANITWKTTNGAIDEEL